MKFIQVKLGREEQYAWAGCGMFIIVESNGLHMLNGHEITSEEFNSIVDRLEQSGVEILRHPDFA